MFPKDHTSLSRPAATLKPVVHRPPGLDNVDGEEHDDSPFYQPAPADQHVLLFPRQTGVGNSSFAHTDPDPALQGMLESISDVRRFLAAYRMVRPCMEHRFIVAEHAAEAIEQILRTGNLTQAQFDERVTGLTRFVAVLHGYNGGPALQTLIETIATDTASPTPTAAAAEQPERTSRRAQLRDAADTARHRLRHAMRNLRDTHASFSLRLPR